MKCNAAGKCYRYPTVSCIADGSSRIFPDMMTISCFVIADVAAKRTVPAVRHTLPVGISFYMSTAHS